VAAGLSAFLGRVRIVLAPEVHPLRRVGRERSCRYLLDSELEQAAGIPQRWYDVLVHLEESPQGIPMNELADRNLYSKSGFTRVVDRMEEAGLVRRARPENDRRTILILPTDKGTESMQHARRHHRDGIQRHFSQHLSNTDIKALTHALEKISTHARPLRPDRIRG
jgi:DNA-binding MarR family transcriptional regulator